MGIVQLVADDREHRPPVWTGHVVLQSRDPITAARFFEQIGMRPVQVEAHFSVLEMRGGTHVGIRYDPEHVAAGHVTWDLMVDDLDAAHAQWEKEGLPVRPIVDGPPHRSFEVTDPDGHVLVVRDSHVVGLSDRRTAAVRDEPLRTVSS